MLAYKKTLEQEIEIEIARIQQELAQMQPLPVIPNITLMDKNVISGAFNSTAAQTMDQYLRQAPRRESLMRGLEYNRRRLLGLRTHRAYAANFSLAA
jgi:hypothetical protein